MLLSIIIINYNVKYFLEQCLDSIYRSRGIAHEDLEIFIVDNHSKDNSIPHIKHRFPADKYPNLYYINNQRNIGFGKANNQAIRRAAGDYLLFLNPDTVLGEDTLADVIRFARGRSDWGVIGVKMLQSDGSFARESRRGLPTPWVSFCKMSGLQALMPRSRTFGRYYMEYLDEDRENMIDIVSGAFMLTSAKALRKTGGFDEDYFMYGEDIDLSYRMRLQGYRNYYVPTPMLHYKGESTKKNSYHYVHVFYEAMYIFFKKHFRRSAPLLAPAIQTAIVTKALFAFISYQLKSIHHYLNPFESHITQQMMYIGHHEGDIQELASQYGIHIQCLHHDSTTLPQGHLSPEVHMAGQSHVVYDLDNYSYSEVLRLFMSHPDPKCHIGFYHPDRNMLTTGGKVFHLVRQ